ncbi:MAG: cupin domain-containing protein [Balneolaceae bacterium]|nr:cupin domain-containing protein [Balneolaceae bacterium]
MLYKTLITVFALSLSVFIQTANAQTEPLPISSTVLLQTTTSWDGTPISYPQGQAEVTVLLIEIAPGESTGWHHHPVPSFAYIIDGEIEVTLEDGQSMAFSKGEAISEVTNQIHIGKNIGETPLKLVVFYTGVKGKDLTISED